MEETTPTAPGGFEESRYLSYLVRLWREAPGAEWRCQVRNVGSGQEQRFVGLAGLFSYLEDQATGPSNPS
jgi:hypothetical protein